MKVTEKLLKKNGLPVEVIDIKGASLLYKIFSSLILVDWTTYYIAENYGVDPDKLYMVEPFKKLIK